MRKSPLFDQKTRLGVRVEFLAILILTLVLAGCYQKETPVKKTEPVPIRTAKVEKRDVQLTHHFTGKTDVDPVQIVPRIRGYIEQVNFFPGDLVEEGTVLYQIEDFDYQNDVNKAKANLDINVAAEAKAKADYDREESLHQQGAGLTTQADIDKTKALWSEATGKVEAARASLAEVEKQLERCVIKAPIRGKINRTAIDKGNLVDGTGSNPPVLTTIMPMDPIFVYFQVTDLLFDRINRAIIETIKAKIGERFKEGTPYSNDTLTEIIKKEGLDKVISFEMGLVGNTNEDGEDAYPFKGVINYNENKIDYATGTITLRGEIKNTDFMIYPGYVCNVRVPGALLKDAILIEEKAICYDLSDVYIWILDEKGLPKKRTITLGAELDPKTRIIKSGLDGTETYITEGFLKVREGVPVREMEPGETVGETSKPAETDSAAPEKKSEAVPAAPEATLTPPKTDDGQK